MRVQQPGVAPDARRRGRRSRTGRGRRRSGGSRRSTASRGRTRPQTLLAIVVAARRDGVALAPPYLVGRAVDEVSARRRRATSAGSSSRSSSRARSAIAFSYAQTYFTGWTGERMLADLRNHLFRHLQRLSLGFYERNRAGVIISRLTNDVEALDQLVTDGVTSLVQNTLTLVGTAVILFFLDWRLALATLTVVPPLALATAMFRKRSGRAYRARARDARRRHGDARRGHRRHARAPVVHARARGAARTSAQVGRPLPRRRTCRRSS